jgi:signal transduction histidine kinase
MTTGSLALRGAGWEGWDRLLNPALGRIAVEEERTRVRLAGYGEPRFGQTCAEVGYQHRRLTGAPLQSPWVQLDLGQIVEVDWLAIVPVLLESPSADRKAYGFPRRFRVELAEDPEFFTSLSAGDFSEQDVDDLGAFPVVLPAQGIRARYVRLTVTKMAEEGGRFFFALGEIMVVSGFRNAAIGCKVTASSSAEVPPRWGVSNLVDGRSHLGAPIAPEMPAFDGYFVGPTVTTEPLRIRLDLGRVFALQQIVLHPIHARLGADVPGYGFPQRIEIAISDPAMVSPPETVYVLPPGFSNPGNNPVVIPLSNPSARWVEIAVAIAARPAIPQRLGFSEIEVFAEGRNVARSAAVNFSPEPGPSSNPGPRTLLSDGFTSSGRILPLAEWLGGLHERALLRKKLGELSAERVRQEHIARSNAVVLLWGVAAVAGIATAAYLWRQRLARRREHERIKLQLARDLHDEIGSNLAGISMLSESAAERMEGSAAQQTEWRKVHRIARDTTNAMREVLWMVGAREESGIDLLQQLRLAADRLLFGRELSWTCEGNVLPEAWTTDSSRQVFLFFKEALANALRHSGASRYEISIVTSSSAFALTVTDNGRGFGGDHSTHGLGLPSMGERARLLGGRCQVESVPGRGTRVTLTVNPAARSNLLARLARR